MNSPMFLAGTSGKPPPFQGERMREEDYRVEDRLLDLLIPDEKELARHDDPDKSKRLGENMLAHGQLQAIGATDDGRLLFGHGRYLAARAVGMKTLQVKIFPSSLDDKQRACIRASENLQRKDLTPFQKWELFSELLELNGWTGKQLSEYMQIDPGTVTRVMSIGKLTPDAVKALKEGRLSLSDCYTLGKHEAEAQNGLLALKLSTGANREELECHSNACKNGTPKKPSVRVTTLKIALGSVQVVIKGDVDLESSVETLKDAIKAVNKAVSDGLDANTAQKVWARMAAKA